MHIHGNSATMAFDLLAAWRGGAGVRITHCHKCAQQPVLKQATLGRVLNHLVTDPVACSRAAGKMLYTKPFRVLVNGIDCERFSYTPAVREQMRRRLGLQKKFCGRAYRSFFRAKESCATAPHFQSGTAATAAGTTVALRRG